MTAHNPKFKGVATANGSEDPLTVMAAYEIARCLDFLLDSKSREQIVDAYLSGQIDGDSAMDALVDLGLIEVPDEN
jgi:hypothetical protein